MATALHLQMPTSTQYVAFPTEGVPVRIAWSEGRQARSAIYHVSKCYWGTFADDDVGSVKEDAVDVPPRPIVRTDKTPSELAVIGETTIFVAQEFIESAFQGGPMLAYHVKDLAKLPGGTVSNWIILQLNDCIHYGQNKSRGKWKRWLVYHPPISKEMRAPEMYQHRFMAPASAEFAKLSLNALPEVTPDEYSVAASATNMIGNLGIDVLKGVVGDPLHRFLGPDELRSAKSLTEKFQQLKMLTQLDETTLRDRWITAIQYVESLNAQTENDVSRIEKESRAKDAAAYLNEIVKQQNSTRSFWDKIFGRRSKLVSTEVSSSEVNKQTVDVGGDHKEVLQDLNHNLHTTLNTVEIALNRKPTAEPGKRKSHEPTNVSNPSPPKRDVEIQLDHPKQDDVDEAAVESRHVPIILLSNTGRKPPTGIGNQFQPRGKLPPINHQPSEPQPPSKHPGGQQRGRSVANRYPA